MLFRSITFSPFFEKVLFVNAQATTYQVSGNTGVKNSINSILPTIAKLPLCKEKIGSAVKKLFTKVGGNDAFQKALGKYSKSNATAETEDLAKKAAEKAAEQEEIKVSNRAGNEKLDKLVVTTGTIDKTTKSLESNDTCLKSIGSLLIKQLLQKITVSTVAWINSGFEGKPFFVQNPGRFYKSIEKDIVLEFNQKLTDSDLYPFAKSFIKSNVRTFNNKFEANAQYSLNKFIYQTTPQFTAEDFKNDFSKGGWGAWMGMTQIAANNPLGFYILASDELQKSLDDKIAEEKDKLIQSAGFLSDTRCADPKNVTVESHREALKKGDKDALGNLKGICKKWEVLTPGKIISEAATDSLKFSKDSLLKADDLNTSIAAIIDALLNRWVSDISIKGFADFSDEGIDGSYITEADFDIDGESNVESDFKYTNIKSDWLDENPDFNLRTDLTQAIIDEQRTYVEKLEGQNKELPKLIEAVRQLDYCIPGPNPNWEFASSVDEYYDTVKETQEKSITPALSAVLSLDVGGVASGIITSILEKKYEKEQRQVATLSLQSMLDVAIDARDYPPLTTADDVRETLESTFESYRKLINKVYFSGVKSLAPMPLVTEQARKEFQKIDGYESIIQENTEDIAIKKSMVVKLSELKDNLDNLDKSDPNYEENLKPFIFLFAILSKSMVTGDNVAAADNILKEAVSQTKFVWDNLIKGPTGCEKESEELFKNDYLTYSKFYRRQPYPYPIDHLYNQTDNKQGPWHIPWSEESVEKMSPNEGFLFGTVYFNRWSRPYDGGRQSFLSSDDFKKLPPPDIANIGINLTNYRNNSCPELFDTVELSHPSVFVDTDIWSEQADTGDYYDLDLYLGGRDNGFAENNCGVVTRKFEKNFGIY